MKKAINTSGVVVEVSDDIVTNNNGGVRYLLTAEERVVYDAKIITNAKEAPQRAAIAEISRLEGQVTQRRLREAALNKDNGWLTTQDNLIANERTKL